MLVGEAVAINGDGETTRDFCYIDNAVQANLLAAITENPDAVNQVYNVAVDERTSLNRLFELLRDALQLHVPGPPCDRRCIETSGQATSAIRRPTSARRATARLRADASPRGWHCRGDAVVRRASAPGRRRRPVPAWTRAADRGARDDAGRTTTASRRIVAAAAVLLAVADGAVRRGDPRPRRPIASSRCAPRPRRTSMAKACQGSGARDRALLRGGPSR